MWLLLIARSRVECCSQDPDDIFFKFLQVTSYNFLLDIAHCQQLWLSNALCNIGDKVAFYILRQNYDVEMQITF